MLMIIHSIIFQSTSPVRGTTFKEQLRVALAKFQSTSPVRGTTVRGFWVRGGMLISIHVPREGDDNGY